MRRIAICLLIALSFVWFGACQRCAAQQIIGRPMLPLRLGCGTFTAQTAVYATTQYLRKTASSFTGLADAKVFTCSFWVRKDDNLNSTYLLLNIDNGGVTRFEVYISNKKIFCDAENSAGSLLLDMASSVLLVQSAWTHVYICVDLTDSTKRHLYFNGVEDLGTTWVTYVNDTIDLVPAVPTETIGASQLAIQKLNGALAEFWFDDVYLNDTTKFLCTSSGNHPISLGATGNTPTGSAPAIYFSLNGSGNSWATDSSGNGNTMTVTGTLGSTTSP